MQTTDITPQPGPSVLLFTVSNVLIIFFVISAIIYTLHFYKKPHMSLDISGMAISPTTITTIMLIIALFGPVSINFYPDPWFGPMVYFCGMTWQTIGFNLSYLMFSALLLLVSIPFMFLRLVFVYQIYKYYQGLVTRKRTFIVGVLSEIQFPLITFFIMPFTIGNPSLTSFIAIPIPLLLLVGLVILYFVNLPLPTDGWKELDTSQDWWETKTQS
ncbi:MAG: hypothetical protein ACFFFK_13120 [Candidatus Thorarchaeota archaeon]